MYDHIKQPLFRSKLPSLMKPDYENVKELVQAKPSIIGNCHLLIEYPMTDYVTYDFLAIYDLQPKSLVLLTTSTCHSGGLMLHMWLNNNGIKTTNKAKTMKIIKKNHGDDAMLSPNALKYNLNVIQKKLHIFRKKIEGRPNKMYIFVSGTRKDNRIIKRPLLSPNYMEHMGIKKYVVAILPLPVEIREMRTRPNEPEDVGGLNTVNIHKGLVVVA